MERVVSELSRELSAAAPGAPLPSVRTLVERLGVSPVTVARALAELSRQGLVVTRPGAGTFVAERAAPRAHSNFDWQAIALGAAPAVSDLELLVSEPPPKALALSHGYMDPSLEPTAALARAARRVLASSGAWARAPLEGLIGLRRWFAQRAGVGRDHNDVILVQGGQAAISTALRAVTSPGAAVLIESPTYVGALAALRSAGLRPVPVPTDGHGLRVEFLEQALRTSGARVLYLQPWFSNPTGSVLAADRREQLLRLMAEYDAFIVEDDYSHDLSYRGSEPATIISADARGHTIYIGSLTKTIAPSMRIACVIARGPVLARLRGARIVDDFFVPRPLQEIALEFVTSSDYVKHVKRLRSELEERMRALVDAVRRHLPAARIPLVPSGGFSLWLELPAHLDEAEFVRRARELDVVVSAGRSWFPAEASGPYLRLSVAAINAAELEDGVQRLARIGMIR